MPDFAVTCRMHGDGCLLTKWYFWCIIHGSEIYCGKSRYLIYKTEDEDGRVLRIFCGTKAEYVKGLLRVV